MYASELESSGMAFASRDEEHSGQVLTSISLAPGLGVLPLSWYN